MKIDKSNLLLFCPTQTRLSAMQDILDLEGLRLMYRGVGTSCQTVGDILKQNAANLYAPKFGNLYAQIANLTVRWNRLTLNLPLAPRSTLGPDWNRLWLGHPMAKHVLHVTWRVYPQPEHTAHILVQAKRAGQLHALVTDLKMGHVPPDCVTCVNQTQCRQMGIRPMPHQWLLTYSGLAEWVDSEQHHVMTVCQTHKLIDTVIHTRFSKVLTRHFERPKVPAALYGSSALPNPDGPFIIKTIQSTRAT